MTSPYVDYKLKQINNQLAQIINILRSIDKKLEPQK